MSLLMQKEKKNNMDLRIYVSEIFIRMFNDKLDRIALKHVAFFTIICIIGILSIGAYFGETLIVKITIICLMYTPMALLIVDRFIRRAAK